MNKILILILMIVAVSCNSDKPASVDDGDDMDNSDTEIIDEEGDESPDEASDVETPDEEPDEYPDETGDDVLNCIPVSETKDVICFGARATGGTCSPSEEDVYFTDHLIVQNKPGYYLQSPIGVNDSYYFYYRSFSDPMSHRIIYHCNRETGKEEMIVENNPSVGSDGSIRTFDVEGKYIAFSYHSLLFHGSRDQSCYLGIMDGDWELKRIADFKSDCYEPQIRWPFVAYRNRATGWVFIYDIRTGETRRLEGFKAGYHHIDQGGKKMYINAVIGDGAEGMESGFVSEGPFRYGIWEVDVETLDVTPVEIFARRNAGHAYASGSYIVYNSRREWMLDSEAFWSYSGEVVVLYDLVNRTERMLTDTVKGNRGDAFMSYPYAGWVSAERDNSYIGEQVIENLETGESWRLTDSYRSMGDMKVLKDNTLIYSATVRGENHSDYATGIFTVELPDPGEVVPNEECDDSNPCTHNVYSVTEGKCTNPPHRNMCESEDTEYPLSVCFEGACKGYHISLDTVEMVEISAGEYYIGGYAPPYSMSAPEHRPWEDWENKAPDDLYLDTYYIDKYEVTQKSYRECVESGVCSPPAKNRSAWRDDYWGNPEYDNYPVLYVSYHEAEKYCLWRGKRLPDEHEWVKAANGGEKRYYPWGDDLPLSDNRYGNVFYSLNETQEYDAQEVGIFSKDISPYGVMDMHGNVSEWTSSNWSYSLDDRAGAWGDQIKVIKGGSWMEAPYYRGWISMRMGVTPRVSSNNVGFRCVADGDL